MTISKEDILKKFDFDGRVLTRKTGRTAKAFNVDGYKIHIINRKKYMEHRIIYFLVHGFWPVQVDHINGVRSDNRPENLRAATHAQNCMNRVVKAKSGKKGCYWDSKRGKWLVQVSENGKRKTVGYFCDLDSASNAFAIAAKKNYGEFARIE